MSQLSHTHVPSAPQDEKRDDVQRDAEGYALTRVAPERALLAQIILDERPAALTGTQIESGRAADLHE